jgi:hypothetical protein
MSITSSIRLRPAAPMDAAAIRDIVRAAYAKWVPVIGREPLPMRADYDKAVAEHPFQLAVEDGAEEPFIIVITISAPIVTGSNAATRKWRGTRQKADRTSRKPNPCADSGHFWTLGFEFGTTNEPAVPQFPDHLRTCPTLYQNSA